VLYKLLSYTEEMQISWKCQRKTAIACLTSKSLLQILLRLTGKSNSTSTLKPDRPSTDVETELRLKAKRGRMATVPQKDVRTDKLDHWQMFDDKTGWCKRPGCRAHQKFIVQSAKFISVLLQIKIVSMFSSLNDVHMYYCHVYVKLHD